MNVSINKDIEITHPEKTLWQNPSINKAQFISYLVKVSPHMLPFLRNRALTVIRYPHGVPGESFFQKHCPDYAPEFIQTVNVNDEESILCNDLSTLIWLGNQLAIEYHIPFQAVNSDYPNEVVFDLDPPDRQHFSLAIKAAKEMHEMFIRFGIVSYPKLSGSRGIQIHIPVHHLTLPYADTRLFTSFIARVLTEKFSSAFTIERLKKNRNGRLYIDYVQHARGKTIVCPYSPRGKEGATVAAPLRWEEVNDQLNMETFTIPFVLKRISNEECPMKDYFNQSNKTLLPLIDFIKKNA
ncbi:non-homologous end-joining DNA ligase [Sporolactobacillus pectinivorans]|uniref:non-homologous end-joining DNA ligase n=1 Tax=Sporolactobacillus pectinivorans TaxID=1591408 RepID=UPI000C25B92E|nr:non-homologous end-joining DNA ligase [Sporolactobacillus pectinivorans]